MEKEFKAIKISTDDEKREVVLMVGDSYSNEIRIPIHQIGMVITLLSEAEHALLGVGEADPELKDITGNGE